MDLDNNNDREERSEKTGRDQFNRTRREDQDSTYNRNERSNRYESYERNTDNRGGGYNENRGGGYNRNNDNRGGGGYNRFNDNRGGGYNENRGGGYNRFNDNRGGGYNENRGGGYNRFNDNRGGGYNENRGYNDRNEREDRPRFEPVYSDKVRAGKRRTYFMDVHQTRSNDYYLTITESTKTPDDRFVRHKIFVYKEDFNRFAEAVNTAIDHIKTNLMPDYDYEEFSRRYDEREEGFDNADSAKAEGASKFPAMEDDDHAEHGEKLHDDFVDELPSLDDEMKSSGLDDGEKW